MTDAGDPEPPTTRAHKARDKALQAFDDLNSDDPVACARGEQQAAEAFAAAVAEAVVDGYGEHQAKQLCGPVSDVSEHYTKTALKQLVAEAIEEARHGADDRRSLDEILQSDLQEVTVVRTTDAKQATQYRWQFNAGSVETTSTKEGREHFGWRLFRDEYYDATGEDAAKPPRDLRDGDDWREFVVEIIKTNKREVTTRGPRSAAVEDLQTFIGRSRAYSDIEYMTERDGLYIDADPRESDPSELWVQNHDIKRICEDNELGTVRELQIELDARDHTVDRVTGVSESTTINDKHATYWVLDADIADPGEFVPDPVDPAEAVRREDETDDEDDDDDGAPGALGSVGGER